MTHARLKIAAVLALAAAPLQPAPVAAADADTCRTVRMSDPGWTDITSTNGLVGTVLDALGYEQEVLTLSVPITYDSLKNSRIDAFLGSWQPAQKAMLEPLQAANQVEVIAKNLEGIRFTLAVPSNLAAEGVKTVDDLAKNADRFDKKIYGIDPGAAANQNIQRMLEKGDHGLAGWELVESSEQAMLAQVERAARRGEAIVFLAWEPHPMNAKFDLTYLAGAEEYFGPRFGASDVYTLARPGLSQDCPNLARLLKQAAFTVPMENEVMAGILDEGESGEDAAAAWLKANPDAVTPWLEGVTTLDGGDGLQAVKEAIGS
jgi:glycine betaine/proline transport system substrate-binding protein